MTKHAQYSAYQQWHELQIKQSNSQIPTNTTTNHIWYSDSESEILLEFPLLCPRVRILGEKTINERVFMLFIL